MISRLSGILIDSLPEGLTVDVSGVGYQVLTSLNTFQKLPQSGESVTLLIHTNVREDDILLFGFLEEREKTLFQQLIKVNGVGPRLALNILSGINSDDLISALQAEDKARITAIPGIGKKTAERIILDLKDKVSRLAGSAALKSIAGTAPRQFRDDLVSVLQNLGYKRAAAEQAIQDVALSDINTLQDAVRETLRHLGENARRFGS